MYHYFGASEIYNAIRVFIACYVWLTGFGNFSYYYTKKDFSIARFAQVPSLPQPSSLLRIIHLILLDFLTILKTLMTNEYTLIADDVEAKFLCCLMLHCP